MGRRVLLAQWFQRLLPFLWGGRKGLALSLQCGQGLSLEERIDSKHRRGTKEHKIRRREREQEMEMSCFHQEVITCGGQADNPSFLYSLFLVLYILLFLPLFHPLKQAPICLVLRLQNARSRHWGTRCRWGEAQPCVAFVPNLGLVLRRTVDVEKGRDRRWARHIKSEMKLSPSTSLMKLGTSLCLLLWWWERPWLAILT